MGKYTLNEGGGISLFFGNDDSSGTGGGFTTSVPNFRDYLVKVVSDDEYTGRADNPDGGGISRLLTCEVLEPSHVGETEVQGQQIFVFLTPPGDKEDGTDKRVKWQWESFLAAMGIDLTQIDTSKQMIDYDPAVDAPGVLLKVKVEERPNREGKLRKQSTIIGVGDLEDAARRAATVSGEAQAEEAPAEEAQVETQEAAPAPAPARRAPAAAAPARAAAPAKAAPAKPAAAPAARGNGATAPRQAAPPARPTARR